jgi:hypothetical protein
MELKIEIDGELCLWLGPDEDVQVPMSERERAQCRERLLSALSLLNETVVKYSTFSKVGGTGEASTQNSPRLGDYPEVVDWTRPSAPQVGSQAPHLRLVSSDLMSSEKLGRDF